jgi:hypothetical protein
VFKLGGIHPSRTRTRARASYAESRGLELGGLKIHDFAKKKKKQAELRMTARSVRSLRSIRLALGRADYMAFIKSSLYISAITHICKR